MSCVGLLSSKQDIQIINLKKWQASVEKSHDIHKFLSYSLTEKKSNESLEYQSPEHPEYYNHKKNNYNDSW